MKLTENWPYVGIGATRELSWRANRRGAAIKAGNEGCQPLIVPANKEAEVVFLPKLGR